MRKMKKEDQNLLLRAGKTLGVLGRREKRDAKGVIDCTNSRCENMVVKLGALSFKDLLLWFIDILYLVSCTMKFNSWSFEFYIFTRLLPFPLSFFSPFLFGCRC